MTRRPLLGASLLTLALVSRPARADEPPEPVFKGHPMLSIYTKEVSGEAAGARLGDGRLTLALGSSMAAFYKPWLSIQGGAQGSPGLNKARQTYDTRALIRLIWPEPLAGRVFVFAGVGATVFFFEDQRGSQSFRRGLGPVGAAGLWVQLTERLRLRAEARDQWLLIGKTDLSHNVFVSLALATQYR